MKPQHKDCTSLLLAEWCQSNIYKLGAHSAVIGHSCLWSPLLKTAFIRIGIRMETLRRKLSVSIKRRTVAMDGGGPDSKGTKGREQTTTNCNQEFDFVNCDAADRVESVDSVDSVDSEVDTMMTMEHCPSLSSGAVCHRPGVQSKRGALWIMSGQFFASWHEKFCVLTENSFYCFSKSLGSAKSKKSFTKICLLDISDIGLVTHKGRTVVTIQTPSTGKLMLMKQGEGPGVEEWYHQIRENVRACFVKKSSCHHWKVRRRPFMGISSLPSMM